MKLPPAWSAIEDLWPLFIGGERVGFGEVACAASSILGRAGIVPSAFSHFGLVVGNIDLALESLSAECAEFGVARRDWVAAYSVFVARGSLACVELELIQPDGESFFADALRTAGEGLQHVSFRVEEIDKCLERLKEAGTDLADKSPRTGSHGKVAFARPTECAPLYVELTEPLNIVHT